MSRWAEKWPAPRNCSLSSSRRSSSPPDTSTMSSNPTCLATRRSMNDLFSLSGKRFLVTGGTRGIGRAITVRFARAGASVVADFVRNLEEAQKLEALAGEEGLDVVLCRGDLTTPKGLDQIQEAVGTGDPKVF